MITVKPIPERPEFRNTIFFESTNYINGAILLFSKGHPFLKSTMDLMVLVLHLYIDTLAAFNRASLALTAMYIFVSNKLKFVSNNQKFVSNKLKFVSNILRPFVSNLNNQNSKKLPTLDEVSSNLRTQVSNNLRP